MVRVVFSCISHNNGESQCRAASLCCSLKGFFRSTFHPSAWIKTWTSSLCAAGSCQTAPVLSAWMTLELFWEPHFPDVEFMCMGSVETGSIYSQPDKPLWNSYKVTCCVHCLHSFGASGLNPEQGCRAYIHASTGKQCHVYYYWPYILKCQFCNSIVWLNVGTHENMKQIFWMDLD